MIDILLILILLLIVSAIVFYLIREKKRGAACVGCPYARQCAARKKSGQCTCSGDSANKSS